MKIKPQTAVPMFIHVGVLLKIHDISVEKVLFCSENSERLDLH